MLKRAGDVNDDDDDNNHNILILNVAFYISMSLTLCTASISTYTFIWPFLLFSVCMNYFKVDGFVSPVRVFGKSPLNAVASCLP